jgi:hypothetical protein
VPEIVSNPTNSRRGKDAATALMVDLLRYFVPHPAAPLPSSAAAGAEATAERVRRLPGVGTVWSHGTGPYLACARHCGEVRHASGSTPREAFLALEEDVRERNRETIREAFRLL